MLSGVAMKQLGEKPNSQAVFNIASTDLFTCDERNMSWLSVLPKNTML